MIDAYAPVEFRVDAEARVVFITLRGNVSFVDMCIAEDHIVHDPGFAAGMDRYVDCRVVTSIPTAEQVRQLAINRLYWSATRPSGRIAFVAMTRLGLEFASTFQEYLDQSEDRVSVFTSYRAADGWLHLNRATVP